MANAEDFAEVIEEFNNKRSVTGSFFCVKRRLFSVSTSNDFKCSNNFHRWQRPRSAGKNRRNHERQAKRPNKRLSTIKRAIHRVKILNKPITPTERTSFQLPLKTVFIQLTEYYRHIVQPTVLVSLRWQIKKMDGILNILQKSRL